MNEELKNPVHILYTVFFLLDFSTYLSSVVNQENNISVRKVSQLLLLLVVVVVVVLPHDIRDHTLYKVLQLSGSGG